MKLTILKLTGFIAVLLWILSGLIVMGSSYFSTALWIVNTIVGVFFLLFAFLLYRKESNFLAFLKQSSLAPNARLYKNLVFYETLFVFFSLFLGLVVFSAVYSRVFLEHFSVFG